MWFKKQVDTYLSHHIVGWKNFLLNQFGGKFCPYGSKELQQMHSQSSGRKKMLF